MKQVFIKNSDFFFSTNTKNKEELCKKMNDVANQIIRDAMAVEITPTTDLHRIDVSIQLYNGVEKFMTALKNDKMDEEEVKSFGCKLQGIIADMYKWRKAGKKIELKTINFFAVEDTEWNIVGISIPEECDTQFNQYICQMEMYERFMLEQFGVDSYNNF